MKVYVVTNQCLMHDSSYYDVIAVCDSLSKAQIVLGTSELDFIENLEREESRGIKNVDFHTRSLSITENSMELSIKDTVTGMFSIFTITDIEIK